ncbi:MAG: bifunctional demethylmenaquinone methyltransferase/2-methoxy-6-polyprenyl-1,4-benzoquinol methylase UbiE [Candidatus Baltobacteraceae bacterium]
MTLTETPRDRTDKGAYVREMFATIAPRYDTANRVLTGGMDEGWRKTAIDRLAPPANGRILDLCCGTGDLSFHLVRRDPSLHVTGIDFCEPMLAGARARAVRESHSKDVTFVEGDVMALPFEENSFDGAMMGFSMRNVVDIGGALEEVKRVLRPGGRFVNLDVSKAPNALLRRAFNLYFYGLVPFLGGLVGGSRRAYTYLPQSLTHHPNAGQLRDRFAAAGFLDCGYQRLMGGTIAIHYGTKP